MRLWFLGVLMLLGSGLCLGQQDTMYINSFGTSSEEALVKVLKSNSGSYYAVGNTGKDGTNGSGDMVLMKLSADSLKPVWSKIFGTPGADVATSFCISSNHEIYVCGFSDLGSAKGYDGIVTKFDSSGNKIWLKTFGSPKWDFFNDIFFEDDLGIWLAGSTYGTIDSSKDGWIFKINSNGETSKTSIFEKNFGESGEEEFNTLTQTKDGFIAAAGYKIFPSKNDKDIYIIRIDDDLSLIKEDTISTIGDDKAYDIIGTNDNGLLVCGSTDGFFTSDLDLYIRKNDQFGNLEWDEVLAYNISGPNGNDEILCVDTFGTQIMVSGYQKTYGYANGYKESFYTILDSAGRAVQGGGTTIGTEGDEQINSVIYDDNRFVAVGFSNPIQNTKDFLVAYWDSIRFTSNPEQLFTSISFPESIIILSAAKTQTKTLSFFDLYGRTLKVNFGFNPGRVTITDLNGRCVMGKKITPQPSSQSIDLTNLANGIYVIKGQSGTDIVISKIIIP